MSEPIQPPPPPSPPPPTAPPPPAADARQQVQGPAIGLVVTGALGLLGALINLVQVFTGTRFMDPSDYGDAEWLSYLGATGGFITVLILVASSGFVIWAGLQMKDLRNWTISVVGAIVAMIPCFGPCCLVGIPIGIWALIVLMKPEVKAAFAS